VTGHGQDGRATTELVYSSLGVRHWLKLREAPAVLKLTAILEYFANVVGERVYTVRFERLAGAGYLLDTE